MEDKPHGESGGSAGTLHLIKESPLFDFYFGVNAGKRMIGHLRAAKKSIRIISPFITASEIEQLREKILGGLRDITLVTTAYEERLQEPAQLKALKKLIHQERKKNSHEYEYCAIGGCNLVFLKQTSVHAKLYVIDDECAYTGSMNFTKRGMFFNYETCITIKEPDTVIELGKFIYDFCKADLPRWDIAELGNKIYSFHDRGKAE
jgi:phosphatidylserine/phosphatidylglycerophosphate/cardiolipin synthase-like enzyme